MIKKFNVDEIKKILTTQYKCDWVFESKYILEGRYDHLVRSGFGIFVKKTATGVECGVCVDISSYSYDVERDFIKRVTARFKRDISAISYYNITSEMSEDDFMKLVERVVKKDDVVSSVVTSEKKNFFKFG
jgi:hypothetical protein